MTFSVSYYDVNQSIVALKTDAIVKKHTPQELKSYVYGDQIGTTGLAYINNNIKPTKTPRVYSTLDQAVLALQTGQIDAIVIDTPDGPVHGLGADRQRRTRSSWRLRLASFRAPVSTTVCSSPRATRWWAA